MVNGTLVWVWQRRWATHESPTQEDAAVGGLAGVIRGASGAGGATQAADGNGLDGLMGAGCRSVLSETSPCHEEADLRRLRTCRGASTRGQAVLSLFQRITGQPQVCSLLSGPLVRVDERHSDPPRALSRRVCITCGFSFE